MHVTTTQAATELIRLRAIPDRNVAPSLVDLRASLDIQHPVTIIAWDYDGDGTIDAQSPDLFEQTVTYTQPGIQLPRVLVTDVQGTTFEATAVVLVEEAAAFEAILNTKWSDMMGALAQGDIGLALTSIATSRREVMRHDLTVLGEHLEDLATLFAVPLQVTESRGNLVVAQALTLIPLGTVQFPLEVEFTLDVDGQWRVRNF